MSKRPYEGIEVKLQGAGSKLARGQGIGRAHIYLSIFISISSELKEVGERITNE